MKPLVLTLLFLFIATNETKVFTNCELASVLKQNGMDGYQGYRIDNWICMAFHESGYNSRAVGPPNSDGSHGYGLFQINSSHWCDNSRDPTANGCNKSCSDFTNDNITDDIDCAKRIARDPQKMDTWFEGRNHCKERNLSKYTGGCKL